MRKELEEKTTHDQKENEERGKKRRLDFNSDTVSNKAWAQLMTKEHENFRLRS